MASASPSPLSTRPDEEPADLAFPDLAWVQQGQPHPRGQRFRRRRRVAL